MTELHHHNDGDDIDQMLADARAYVLELERRVAERDGIADEEFAQRRRRTFRSVPGIAAAVAVGKWTAGHRNTLVSGSAAVLATGAIAISVGPPHDPQQDDTMPTPPGTTAPGGRQHPRAPTPETPRPPAVAAPAPQQAARPGPLREVLGHPVVTPGVAVTPPLRGQPPITVPPIPPPPVQTDQCRINLPRWKIHLLCGNLRQRPD